MQVETINHSSGEQIALLLDSSGMPLVAPNEYILGKRNLSTNTQIRNLRELAILFEWLEVRQIDLWQRISSGKLFNEPELSSIREALRKTREKRNLISLLAVKPRTFNQRLLTVIQYLVWCTNIQINSLADNDSRYERFRDRKNYVIKTLEGYFIASPPTNKYQVKGLTEAEISFLLSCFHPSNPDSIGRNKAVRFRNYVSILILAITGLRPGELLCLKVEDIEFGAINSIRLMRRGPDALDMRKPRPRVKRNGRIIPIEPEQARIIDEYILDWREQLTSSASVETPYLIVSDEGIPLSQSALTQMFQNVRRKFPAQLPWGLSAKTLRHSFSSQMERFLFDAGLDEEARKESLAYLRGDSSLTAQEVYTGAEIQRRTRNILQHYQRSIFNGESNYGSK